MTSPLADRVIEAQRQRQARLAGRDVASREGERATERAMESASAGSLEDLEPSRTEADPDAPVRGMARGTAAVEAACDPALADPPEAEELGHLRRVVAELLDEWDGLAESISSLKADLLYRDAIEAICEGDAANLHRALAPLHAELRGADRTATPPDGEELARQVEASAAEDRTEEPSRVAAEVSPGSSKQPGSSTENAPSADVLAKLNEMLSLLGEHLRTNADAARELDPRKLTEEIAREVAGKVRDAVRRDVARELDARGSERSAAPEPRRSKLLRFGSASRERPKTEAPADTGAPRVSLDDVPALIDMLTHPK